MKTWETKFLELENSLNLFRESKMKRLVGLDSLGTENGRRISELWAKINIFTENVPTENQQVNFAISGHDSISR